MSEVMKATSEQRHPEISRVLNAPAEDRPELFHRVATDWRLPAEVREIARVAWIEGSKQQRDENSRSLSA